MSAPTSLLDSLQSLRRRVRALGILYGGGIVVASTAALLVGVVLLDYLLDLAPAARVALVLMALVVLGRILYRWVIRPAMRSTDLATVAGKLESAFPAFDDRLRSAVDFATHGSPGSQPMKDRVTDEAEKLATQVNLNRAIDARPIWQSLLGAGGAVGLVVLLCLLIGPGYFDAAMSRLLRPFDGRAWPKSVEIRMVGDLPSRIAAGQRLDVRIRLARGDRASREARVYYQYGQGPVEKEIMNRSADGVYSAALDSPSDVSALSTIKVWTEAGDDKTPPQSVQVVPRLALHNVDLFVTPPDYAQQPPTTSALDGSPATVVVGSQLGLRLSFNKPLGNQPVLLEPVSNSAPIPALAWDPAQGSTISGHWVAGDSMTFVVHAVDADGLPNADMTEYQVIVRPDQPPTIQITQPARNEECTPQATVPIRAVAEDDFGIQSLQLMSAKLGEKPQPLSPIELIRGGQPINGASWVRMDSPGDVQRWQMDYSWDLSKLISPGTPLKSGDVIEYWLRAQDNFELQGQRHDPVDSARYRVTVMSQEQFTTLMSDMMAQIRQQLVEIGSTQRALRDQTADFRHETQDQPALGKADIVQDAQIVDRQTTAASQTRQAAQKLDEIVNRMDRNKSTASDLRQIAASARDDLNQVAEQPMKQAAGQIDTAKDEKPQARNDDLDHAQANQQLAADKLDELVSRLGEAGGLAESIRKLKDILSQQHDISQKVADIAIRNLGKQPDQMDPADAKALQDTANREQALAQTTQKAIEQMNQSARKLEKIDAASSQAMRQATQTADKQDVVPQMRNAADQQRQNQQAGAQQSQAQVQIGLQMMVRQLEEAQANKLAELARRLADLQQQLAELIRQQSSLNYNNLAFRGDNGIKKADKKIIDVLMSDAQLDPAKLPPTADPGTQARLQEQTEHNARSVSKAAQSLPSGTQVATDVGRAADRMGRAITFLRDDDSGDEHRLAAAYDPSQVEALAALKRAKAVVDDQAAKNAEALNQQRKDTIRAAYEKILTAQQKIDVDTAQIDNSPLLPDGSRAHRQAVRLGQLPGEQSVLADRTLKLNDDLSSLGGLVYVWANNDIADSMQVVRADLAKPATGKATQAQQVRIEQQIQAMIDSLKVQPKKSQFAQMPGGGGSGGGQCKPGMPPEAELRLLKRLQQAINTATDTISEQPNPDNPALVTLGTRQGQLRTLLDQLLRKASGDKIRLDPEPGPQQRLPEESADPDKAELEHTLEHGDQTASNPAAQDVEQVGARMSRSHVRLADDHDPGKTTQAIQKGILANLDVLIDMARQEQADSNSPPSNGGSPSQAQASDPSGRQPGNQGQNGKGPSVASGHTPASVHTNGHDTDATGTPVTDITQTLKEWGSVSPRKRAAVIEAGTEKPVDKYKDLIDDYYRALGEKTGDQQ